MVFDHRAEFIQLLAITRPQPYVHRLYPGGCGERVFLRKQHRHGEAAHVLDQLENAGGRWYPSGQHQPGQPGMAAGGLHARRRQDNVVPIAGSDAKRALLHVGQHILHMHGNHLCVQGNVREMGLPGDDLRAQGILDVQHPRSAEHWVVGNHSQDRHAMPLESAPQAPAGLLILALGHAVDDNAEDLAALLVIGPLADLDVGDQLVQVELPPALNQDNLGLQGLGNVHVDVELKLGQHPSRIGPLDDHHVLPFRDLCPGVLDRVKGLLAQPPQEVALELGEGDRTHVAQTVVEVQDRPHGDHVLVHGRAGDKALADRLEVPHALDRLAQRVGQAHRDGRLAAGRLRRSNEYFVAWPAGHKTRLPS